MNKKWILLYLLALLALAATMASSAYVTRICGDAGGGPALSTTLKTRGSIGGVVDGQTSSGSYVCYSGALARRAEVQVVVSVESISKSALTTAEQCLIKWHSSANGDFYVEVGGSGTPGSGSLIDSGTCIASVSVDSWVYESDLPDNQHSTIYIIVDTGSGTHYAAIALTDDQIAPEFTAFDLVRIQGTVDDPTVTEVVVKIAGQPDWQVPVISGSYDCTTPLGLSPSGTTEAILEATNGEGMTVQKKIRIW